MHLRNKRQTAAERAAERAAGATIGPILAAKGSNYGTWIQGLQKSHPGPIMLLIQIYY